MAIRQHSWSLGRRRGELAGPTLAAASAFVLALTGACAGDGADPGGSGGGSLSASQGGLVTSVGDPGSSSAGESETAATSGGASDSAGESTTTSATGESGEESTTEGEGTTEESTTGEATTTTTSTTTTTTGGGDACDTVLAVMIRDFTSSHPDFESYTGDAAYPGIVELTLGPDKKPVYAHPGPTAQTSGPANFAHWYNHTPGINLPFNLEIELTESLPGVYTYDNPAFFPIDDQGFGNEGWPHNYLFTTEIHASFKYEGGEIFTFTGDDDLWTFINGKLAIDLGGLHPPLTQTVDLDAMADFLGIVPGGTYPMDIFHAERHTDQSNFRIDTSIQCFVPL